MATTQQSGFAPAASPLASTIGSDHGRCLGYGGLHSSTLPGDQHACLPCQTKAKHDGPLPVVIVVQEIFGVHEHIRDICRRLQHWKGYLAIAPELYFREGDRMILPISHVT